MKKLLCVLIKGCNCSMAKCHVCHCGRTVHLKGTSGRESESLDDDRVSSCCVALSVGMILSYPCILHSDSVTSCPFFDCEGLARANALSVAGLPVLEVEGVESAVVFATFNGFVWAASVVFLFFADECGPDS